MVLATRLDEVSFLDQDTHIFRSGDYILQLPQEQYNKILQILHFFKELPFNFLVLLYTILFTY